MQIKSLLTILYLSLVCSLARATTEPVVLLRPGDDVQRIVSNHQPGTTFHLEPGTYRLQQIKPKDSDSFIGEGESTVLNGSMLITSFRRTGKVFSAKYTPPHGQVHGECDAKHPMCSHPEDCFVNNKPLRRVESMAQLSDGTWFLDETGESLVLADDPTGKTIEVSTARCAFSGQATNVVISDMIVEKYAIPAQMGAIGDQRPARAWSILRCTVRLNHGAGINASDESVIRNNVIVMNGQIGLSGHGSDIEVSNNEIASNNFAGFLTGWEAGGTKFSRTTKLHISGNIVHDNQGPGLWTDIDNRQVDCEDNTVFDNAGEGIKHEISFQSKISANTVWGNGKGLRVWLWGAQILIQNSSDVDVSGNRVLVPRDYGNGIAVIIQNRNPYSATNNSIHDNDITYMGNRGMSGVACDYSPEFAIVSTNHFEHNHYHGVSQDAYHWFWKNKAVKWDELVAGGREHYGTIDDKMPLDYKDKAEE